MLHVAPVRSFVIFNYGSCNTTACIRFFSPTLVPMKSSQVSNKYRRFDFGCSIFKLFYIVFLLTRGLRKWQPDLIFRREVSSESHVCFFIGPEFVCLNTRYASCTENTAYTDARMMNCGWEETRNTRHNSWILLSVQELAGYTGGDVSFLKEDFEFQLNKQLLWDSVIFLKEILVVEIMAEVTESVSYDDFSLWTRKRWWMKMKDGW